jgi:ankyrin repeat protein
LPPLPATATEAQPEKAKTDAQQNNAVVTSASGEVPKKKHHTNKAAIAKSTVNNTSASNYFRSERLPDTIYRKSYDKLNRHLPKAYYESDYDGLVFVAAQHDDINGLRSVLDAGRDMELVDAEGDTPLLVAVKHNAINTTRLLLARHANYNVTDSTGMTPMQIAQRNGNAQMVLAIQAADTSSSATP